MFHVEQYALVHVLPHMQMYYRASFARRRVFLIKYATVRTDRPG